MRQYAKHAADLVDQLREAEADESESGQVRQLIGSAAREIQGLRIELSNLREAVGDQSSGVRPQGWLARVASSADTLGFSGIALVSYGLWLIYSPLGYIGGGALLIATTLLGARK